MIKNKEDYRYFTHLLGKVSVIPLSKACLRAYPCKLEVFSDDRLRVLDLAIAGPVKDFTHLLHIEKARVEVFGIGEGGYFHVYLFATEGAIFIKNHRGDDLSFSLDGKEMLLKKGERLLLLETETMDAPHHKEKISFGCYKTPLLENNIDRLTKLYSLSQLIPQTESMEIEISAIEYLLTDLFSPQKEDKEHRGLNLPTADFDKFALFSSFKRQMRASILIEKGDTIFILPEGKKLPISGRAINFLCKDISIAILWRKNRALQVEIESFADVSKTIIFPGNVKKFRIKNHLNEKGCFVISSQSITLKKGSTLYIDRITY